MEWMMYIKVLSVVGVLSLFVQVGLYISENWLSPSWRAINKPVTFTELVKEWLIYITLFSGLATLLDELMNLACSICEPSFLFSAF
jgi:hypothetical protein